MRPSESYDCTGPPAGCLGPQKGEKTRLWDVPEGGLSTKVHLLANGLGRASCFSAHRRRGFSVRLGAAAAGGPLGRGRTEQVKDSAELVRLIWEETERMLRHYNYDGSGASSQSEPSGGNGMWLLHLACSPQALNFAPFVEGALLLRRAALLHARAAHRYYRLARLLLMGLDESLPRPARTFGECNAREAVSRLR